MSEKPEIVKSSSVLGGKARIDGTRIRVIDVVGVYKQGLSFEQIAKEFDLSLPQVLSALLYYYEHREKIDEELVSQKSIEQNVIV